MADNITRHLTHIKSKVVESGLPKLPTSLQIKEGEIAINYAKNNEILSIKNESGDVVTFETKQVHVGTCSTDGSINKKEVSVDAPFVLKKGVIVAVKYSYSNTTASTNVTLNVNDTGDKGIYYSNSVYTGNSTTVCGVAGRVITYLYDGTNWVWLNHGIEDDSTYTVVDNLYSKYNNMLAAANIYRYQILVHKNENNLLPINTINNETGTTKTLTTEEFDPFGGIYYYSTTTSAQTGSAIGTGKTYQEILADLRYSFNTGKNLTQSKSVYLVVVPQANGKVKLASNPISQTLPTTDDGLVYIRLGNAYNDYQVQLEIPHTAYQYKFGELRQYVGSLKAVSATTAENATNATSATTAQKISTTAAIGSAIKPVFIKSDGVPSACTYSIESNVPTNAVFTDSATTLNGHYTPISDAGSTKTKSAPTTTEINWGTGVISGITLSGDTKGHITGISVSGGKLKTPNNGTFSISGNGVVVASTSADASVNTGLNIKGGGSVSVITGQSELTISSTSASYQSGTSSELSAGTVTTQKVWNAVNLKGGVNALINDKLGSGFTGANSAKTVTEILEGTEESISAAINNLNEEKASSNITILASSGLTGGGDLTNNRLISLAPTGTSGSYTNVQTDVFGRVVSGKTISLNALSGLTGGGVLSATTKIGLATVGTPGTYSQVVVDEYGRVTSGTSGGGGLDDLSGVTETISVALNNLDDRLVDAENALSYIDFMTGHNTVSSLYDIPTNKRLVIAKPTSVIVGASFGLMGDSLPDGREIHIIINNVWGNTISISLSSLSSPYKVVGNTSVEIEANSYGEINVISDGTTLYVRGS